MKDFDVRLPSKFMLASVQHNKQEALRLAKLLAEQHDCELKAELDALEYSAQLMLTGNDQKATISMVKELRS